VTSAVPFVLCADDYGLAPGVSRAILDLIGRGRLSATSCMTVTPFWREHAAWLKPLADKADIGLHLTFTDHAPLAPRPSTAPGGHFPAIGALIKRAYQGRLDGAEIRAEVARQIDAFTDAFGRPPAFLDGHQHAHLLPTLRDAVVEAARRLPGAYVRNCAEPWAAVMRQGVETPKALVISGLGIGFRRLARRRGLPMNRRFRGVYDFSGRIPFDNLMARFTADLAPGTLIMVHPGAVDDDLRAVDRVTDQRAVEYAYLKGEAFGKLLEKQRLRVARFGG